MTDVKDMLLRAYVWQAVARAQVWDRLSPGESGEGVISAAIAVLIMAFLGVAVWLAFKATLGGATKNVDTQVNQIGR